MKWYIINYDSNSNTVDLILDHNTTSTVAWGSDNTKQEGPKVLLNKLKEDTDKWNSSLIRNDKNTYKQSSESSYNIDYSGYKARLLKLSDVLKITGSSEKTLSTYKGNGKYSAIELVTYYIDTMSEKVPSKYNYGWLYDRSGVDCSKADCSNNAESSMETMEGYWIDYAEYTPNFNYVAFSINKKGSLSPVPINKSNSLGVRPVISVKKSLVEGKGQSVDVGDTSKNIFIDYIAGLVILVLGVMVVIQTYMKNRKNVKVKE